MEQATKELLSFLKREYSIKTRGRSLEKDLLGLATSKDGFPTLEEIEDVICEVFKCTREYVRIHNKRPKRSVPMLYFCHVAKLYYPACAVGSYKGKCTSAILHINAAFKKNLPLNYEEKMNIITSKLNK